MSTGYINLPIEGVASWKDPVDTAGDLPVSGNALGDARAAKDTGVIYVWTGSSWDTAVAGVGTVTSVGITAELFDVAGSPVTGAGTLALTLADQSANTVFAGPASGADAPPTFRSLEAGDLPPISGNANAVAGFDGAGELYSIPALSIDTTSGGLNINVTEEPDGETNGFTVNATGVNFSPLQDSPQQSWTINNVNVLLDVDSSGFDQGTDGTCVTVQGLGITHQGTGDVGNLAMVSTNFQLGNGGDPISVGGLAYMFGFGTIAADVTITGGIQGYGFQPTFDAASILGSSSYFQAFYDYGTVPIACNSYDSFVTAPTIASINNNHNAVGVNIHPNITTLTGNAGYFGVAISPNIGTVNSGSAQCININPTVTLNKNYVSGIDVNMNNVTNYAGVAASLVVQDITYTFNNVGDDANSYTVEYTDTVTAGNEVATLIGQAITVAIQSGVSTATQVEAAWNANATLAANVDAVITGTASDPQVTAAATNFAGGINAGRKLAANFVGDVSIDGALSFTGALSIGKLTSFATQAIVDGGGAVGIIDSLVTNPTVAASATIANADTIGVATPMLLTVGDNATVTTSFLGIAALGLPAVASIGAGATVDLVEGAVFALSLDAGAPSGGTIDTVALCRSVAIPNAGTTVNNVKGYVFDLPFGAPVGSTSWGLYSTPAAAHNYMAGDLKIGTTDLPTNSSVALEIESTTKAFLNARMTSTQRDNLTAINGMQIYNTTTDKLQVYAGGAWVDLH